MTEVDVPAGIGFMQLAMAAPDAATFASWVAALPAGDPVRMLAEAHPDGWGMVHDILEAVDHRSAAGDVVVRMRQVAAQFDRAARLSPEASVALYTLGDPAMLAAATAEIVDWLAARELIGRMARVLDIGCGIGRMEQALAGRVGHITGIDISAEMVAEARLRCGGNPNVTIRATGGTDLRPFPDAWFDLVLAVDSFPYIVAAGADLVERFVAEAARVLKPAGALAIFNYGYEGGPPEHVADLTTLADRVGLDPVEMGAQPFSLWDGRAFLLRKPQRRAASASR